MGSFTRTMNRTLVHTDKGGDGKEDGGWRVLACAR